MRCREGMRNLQAKWQPRRRRSAMVVLASAKVRTMGRKFGGSQNRIFAKSYLCDVIQSVSLEQYCI